MTPLQFKYVDVGEGLLRELVVKLSASAQAVPRVKCNVTERSAQLRAFRMEHKKNPEVLKAEWFALRQESARLRSWFLNQMQTVLERKKYQNRREVTSQILYGDDLFRVCLAICYSARWNISAFLFVHTQPG
jgi:hypothetical protein